MFTKNIRRDIEEKQLKLEYIQNCANDLLKKEVDARGLTLNVAELAKFAQQMKTLLKRIDRLKDNLTEHHHSRQPIDTYLADLQDIVVRIQGDLRAKEDSLRAPTPFGVQLEHLPTDFSYVTTPLLGTSRRKLDALRDLVHRIQQEFGSDLRADPMIADVMAQWTAVQALVSQKDDELTMNREQWRDFQDQLKHLEQIAHDPSLADELRQRLDSISRLADCLNDHSNEWMLVEHRLRCIREQCSSRAQKRGHRECKVMRCWHRHVVVFCS